MAKDHGDHGDYGTKWILHSDITCKPMGTVSGLWCLEGELPLEAHISACLVPSW